NVIIENFHALRDELARDGVSFTSETDTEVVAHLLASSFGQTQDLTEAMLATSRRLEGAFTLLALHADEPGTVVGARRNSPLVIGLGDGENFLGSDVSAFISSTRQALEIGQDQVVTITADELRVVDAESQVADGYQCTIDWEADVAVKCGSDTYKTEEIHDQPKAVTDTLLGRFDESSNLVLEEVRVEEYVLRGVEKIIDVACGTAAYAGHVAK